MADAFQPKFVDMVRNTTTSVGTVNFQLGPAVMGYVGFTVACAIGDSFYYSVIGIDRPNEVEVGRGTLLANGTISRDPIGGVKTNFSTGAKTIALIAAAEWYQQMQALVGGSANAAVTVADRAALAASSSKTVAFLREAGREGAFSWDGNDRSALVTADTRQGLSVAPAGDPSGTAGAWVRNASGAVNVRWFGAKGDGVTDDGAAFVAAIALLRATATATDGYDTSSAGLFVPAGHYYLGTTTLELNHGLVIQGETSPFHAPATKLRWAENTTGIRAHSVTTAGASSVVAAHSYGKPILRNLGLVGPVAGTEGGITGGEAEYHGIHVKTAVIVEDCYINGFRGDGVYAETSGGGGGGLEGNSNMSTINRLFVTNVRNGVFVDGADANAWVIQQVIGFYCRQWTVLDSSFLGNTHIGHHSANAGLIAGVPPCVVSYSGNQYACRAGQEAAASTNTPSGTSFDNPYWIYMGAGGAVASLNVQPWTSGMMVRAGGSYLTDSVTAANTMIGLYAEGGQGPEQFAQGTLTLGGAWGTRNPTTIDDVIANRNVATWVAPGQLMAPVPTVLGQTKLALVSDALPSGEIWNAGPLTGGRTAKLDFSIGQDSDGRTPVKHARISASGSNTVPNSSEGSLVVSLRKYTTGVITDRFMFSEPAQLFGPVDDSLMDLGRGAAQWRRAYLSSGVVVAGNQVVGARGASLPADATDLASALTLVNAIKARLKTTGGHGLVAD